MPLHDNRIWPHETSAKGTFVEIPNAREVTRVGKVKSFQLNGMETQGFPSAKPHAPFRGIGPAL